MNRGKERDKLSSEQKINFEISSEATCIEGHLL